MKRCLLLVVALLLGAAPPRKAAGPAWLEGESPMRATVKFRSAGWGPQGYLSGGKWLFANVEAGEVEKTVPAEGAVLEYDFAVAQAGDHEVWARVGYEFVRSPFRWRIDKGTDATVEPTALTTDLMALGDWAEVAWLKLGTAALETGTHTFTLTLPRTYKPGKKTPERILFGLDCVFISKQQFRPNGPHHPGADWRSAEDRKAAETVYKLPAVRGEDRATLPLAGLWQVARFDEDDMARRTEPDKELPAGWEALPWKSIQVPGNRDEVRPDLTYCHRLLYRCRIHVPEGKPRACFLRFPSTSLIASVLVNGTYCGHSKAPCARWECDVTRAIKPGAVNEVIVAIKDVYYALAQTGDGKSARYAFNVPPSMFHNAGGLGLTRYADFPVLYNARRSGILEAPSLVMAPGGAYVADVFARPSVKKKELALEVTLHNAGTSEAKVTLDNEVVPLSGGAAEKTFAPAEVIVPAGGEKVVTLTEAWEKPSLWWPDDPKQYHVVTRLSTDKDVHDRKLTKFGFREWEHTGKTFALNGIPWHFRADLTNHDRPPANPDDAVKEWQRTGQNMVRYWSERPWTGRSQEETLDFFDSRGVPVRRSGILDGQVASYLLVESKGGKTVPRKDLFDNWIAQLRAWVRAERNHPSVFVWSIENEITYINTRNFGWLDAVEPEVRRAAQAVMALDPTRPAMIDGGDALRDRSLPVYGNHYNESALRDYPDEAYTMARALVRWKTPPVRDPWPIGDDKPLFLGESFFASGYQPSAFAQLSGEKAFLGWPEARQGVGLFAKMLSEGYRWWGVSAFHFWLGPDRGDLHHNSWQPVCLLCREWNGTFKAGQRVRRTLKLFNDTRFDDPITWRWELRQGDAVVAFKEGSEALAPGAAKEFAAEMTAPHVKGRTGLDFLLTCKRGDKEVFREVKRFWVLPEEGPAAPKLEDGELAVLDPKGVVRKHLDARKVPFTAVDSFEKLPSEASVVVVGPDALTPRQATDPKWQALALAGTRVIVLEQTNPLRYLAVPADLEATTHTGRVAFSENLEHPVFAGLDQPDFFCWSGNHIVYRNAYRKASRGARSLVQCDEGLSCSALSECAVRDGLLLLCQMPVGAKLAGDAVAQRLFDNMLAYAASYKPVQKKTAIVFANEDRRAKLLEGIGLSYQSGDGILKAISEPGNEIVVADARPGNLDALVGKPELLKAFTDRGGYLMLWGLTPYGLKSFNRLVGFDHVIRPFRMERVSLPAVRDPILAGLTMRDVVLESTKKIFPWSGDLYPADNTFTHVVDLDDIAPFCTCDNPYAWSQMTNGLVSADAWVFIFSHDLKTNRKPRWTATLPKEEEITTLEIVPNTFYHHLRKLKLVFDGKEAEGVTLDLEPAIKLQRFALDPPRKARTLTLVPETWDAVGKQEVISIENLWLRVKRPEHYHKTVVPLLNIGGLVKYRQGKGGIVLNQVRVDAAEANPINAEKKRTIVSTLLRNLGATFASGKVLVAGSNVRCTPIPLAEKCNQYLTADKGWLAGGADLGHLPVGEQTFTGVRYLIRDFRTSPVPSCIMLAGKDAKGDLPEKVSDIPVDQSADVLFFLHTFHPAREWKPAKPGEQPPVVVQYVVRYEDGDSVLVPVRLGVHVGNWLVTKPVGLPDAAAAWAAPPAKAAGGKQAVVYQMQWTNPRPGVRIKSLDMRYSPRVGNSWGVPVLLAVTAGREE
jgi:beta-galactosidase